MLTQNRQPITVLLCDDAPVKVDPRSLEVGGSFQQDGRVYDEGELPRAWNDDLLAFFFEQTRQVEEPVVLDVGANTGAFTLLTAHHPGMRVEAFEPNWDIAKICERNARLNALLGRFYVHRFGLWEMFTYAPFAVPLGGQSGLGTFAEKHTRFSAGVITWTLAVPLDFVVGEWRLSSVDFLKLDVEGAELAVLRGGEHMIQEHRPKMLVEYEARNTAQFGYEPHEITDLLESWGAQWEVVGRDGRFVWVTWD